MQRIRKYMPFIASSVLLVMLVVFYYPYCKYYIDPDATAYLTISQRYADGDFFNAINGYWSPWSCWLTALFIKVGTSAMAGAITANAIAGVLLLWVTQSFFLKYSIRTFSQWWLCMASAMFLSYAVYWQNFDDLWECFFLLYALRMMVSHKFRHTPWYWVGAGVLGALAYFAKAYAFPFFILSSLFITFYITRAWRSANRVEWLKIASVMIVVMIACSLPWLYALHHKYGIWTTGTAGALNMSWYLVGHPYWKEGIQFLLPPPYPHSVSYWEDPWLVNGATPKFWSSVDLLMRQLLKLLQNGYKFTISSLHIGIGFLLVWIYMIWLFLFRKARKQQYRVYYSIIIPYLLFPFPFFLINFEARYIWYMLPLSMVLGASIMKRNRLFNKRWAMVLFAISYIVWPLYSMRSMWNVGKQEYQLAQKLKQENIIGRYTSNVIFGNPEAVAMQRVAYFTGNAYYIMHKVPASFQELLPELRKHNVKYYYYYPKYNPDWKMIDEAGIPMRVVYKDTIQGFQLLNLRSSIAEGLISDVLQSLRNEDDEVLFLVKQTPLLTFDIVGRTLHIFFRDEGENDTVTSLKKLKEFMPLETAIDITRQLKVKDSLIISDYRKYHGVQIIEDSLGDKIYFAREGYFTDEKTLIYKKYFGKTYKLSLPVFSSSNEYAIIFIYDFRRHGYHGEGNRVWIYRNVSGTWKNCGYVL